VLADACLPLYGFQQLMLCCKHCSPCCGQLTMECPIQCSLSALQGLCLSTYSMQAGTSCSSSGSDRAVTDLGSRQMLLLSIGHNFGQSYSKNGQCMCFGTYSMQAGTPCSSGTVKEQRQKRVDACAAASAHCLLKVQHVKNNR
jgi:hypothetical protein